MDRGVRRFKMRRTAAKISARFVVLASGVGLIIYVLSSRFSYTLFFASYFTESKGGSKISSSDETGPRFPPPFAYGHGRRIWPVHDRIDDDRIFDQLDYLREFAENRTFASTKVVLRIGGFNFDHLLWKDGRQHLIDDKCPVTDCWFTSNLSLFPTADAVVISEFDWKDAWRFTPKPRHQIWIALYLEPPHLRPLNSRALGGLVNWTASYRRDSTIVIPYGKWYPISGTKTSKPAENRNRNLPVCSDMCSHESHSNCSRLNPDQCRTRSNISKPVCNTANCQENPTMKLPHETEEDTSTTHTTKPTVNYARGRTKLVAMFVSSCEDTNGRRRYAWELSKYVAVDVYGDCGGFLSCPKSEKRACFKMLRKNYKFFLSFENSNCVGYITEKLHTNALLNNVVPIVMGARAEDYAAAAPPGSYIHVEDFDGPRELAEYLKLLDSNDTLYNEYFRYKRKYRYVDINDTRYWCRLCGLLHLRDQADHVDWYADFDERTRAACTTGNDGSNQWKTWKSKGVKISRAEELSKILMSLMK